MPYLILPSGRQVPAVPPHLTIGSDAACDMCLTDALIAPRHAIIQYDGQNWRVAKLNLNAVVWLNGRPLQAMTQLRDGDQLWVGETRMIWREQAGSANGRPSLSNNSRTLLYALILLIAIFFGLWGVWTVFSARYGSGGATHIVYSSPQQGSDNASHLQTPPPLHTLVVPAPTATATPTLIATTTLTIPPTSAAGMLVPSPASTLATISPTPVSAATPTIKSAGAKISLSPTATLSRSPTLTATRRPSPTPRHRKPTPRPTKAPTPCTPHPPRNWRQMTVQRGQTLSLLAQRYHTTVTRLQAVNCLSSDLILVGQKLWVPALPTPTPQPTKRPTATGEITITPTPSPTPTEETTPTTAPTNTPVSPTDTPAPPTDTPIPTDTPVSPTNTPIPSDTPAPATDTPIPTDTPVSATDTPVPTDTPVSVSSHQVTVGERRGIGKTVNW